MPRGGTLTIETGNVQIDEGHARQHVGVGPGAYVMLAVSDTGIGMDEETRYLPRVTEGTEPASVPAPPRLAELPGGSETVLVLEDEESLRAIVREMLEGAGYAVLEAADGAEALHVVQRHEGPIDLLLSDVILPGMSGPELARSLVEMRPSLKVPLHVGPRRCFHGPSWVARERSRHPPEAVRLRGALVQAP